MAKLTVLFQWYTFGASVGVTLYGIMYHVTQSYNASLIACAVMVVLLMVCGEIAQIKAKPLKAEFTEV